MTQTPVSWLVPGVALAERVQQQTPHFRGPFRGKPATFQTQRNRAQPQLAIQSQCFRTHSAKIGEVFP
jgi:hypothetical protein